jgi:hypothetical protein
VFLPWAVISGVYTEAGTENDGIVALPLALAGAAAVYRGRSAALAWLAAALAVALIGVGIVGVLEVQDGIEDLTKLDDTGFLDSVLGILDLKPKVGEGLYLLLAGAVGALIFSAVHARELQAATRETISSRSSQ